MAIGVLIIGDEILSGRRADQHLVKAIELLAARGMRLSWARYCGDERPRLIETLQQSFASDDIVFSFGGIGATPDDHTRQCAAAALGVDIALHPEAEREIRAAIAARSGEQATPQQLVMGDFPVGSSIIPNPYNRIPGFALHDHHFFPGFPQMAWPMMEWVLDMKYGHLHHVDAYVEESIAVFDARESDLIDFMSALQQSHGVTIFSLPSLGGDSGRRHIELGAKGSPDAVTAAMAQMRTEIKNRGYEWSELD